MMNFFVQFDCLPPVFHRVPMIGMPLGFDQPDNLGLNSIEFQQDVQQNFQQSAGHSVRLKALLKIMFNTLSKFN